MLTHSINTILILYFFCANILEDRAQWHEKTKGLSKLDRDRKIIRELSMDV